MAKGSIAAMLLWVGMAGAVQAADLGVDAEFRGIRLGSKLPEAFPECAPPKSRFGVAGNSVLDESIGSGNTGEPCFWRMDSHAIEEGWKPSVLVNLPRVLGIGNWAGITIWDEHIEEIEVIFSPVNYLHFRGVLVDKFGPPSGEDVKTFQNAFGQVTAGRSATWTGSGAILRIDEHRAGKKEWGYITMTSRRYLQVLDDRARDSKRELGRAL